MMRHVILIVILLSANGFSQSYIFSPGSVAFPGAVVKEPQSKKPITVTADGGETFQEVVPTERPGRFSFSAKMPEQPVAVPESVSKNPIIDIYLSTGKCPPCDSLKAAVRSGMFYGAAIRWHVGNAPFDENGNQWYPTIVAPGRIWRGFRMNATPAEVLGHLGIQKQDRSDQEKPKRVVSAVSTGPKLSPPVRYIDWPGWGTIDLETYNLDCSCSMCVSIRSKQQDYWRLLKEYQQSVSKVSPDQEGCPHDVVETMLDQMRLRTGIDVLADLGCGDGRILIAAARRGIRGIGIEIDPVRADVARRNVERSGFSDLVTIETGDALEFDTSRCTATTTYLYPPLLAKLAPKLQGLRVVASPFHKIPGMLMTQAGDVWIYRNGKG